MTVGLPSSNPHIGQHSFAIVAQFIIDMHGQDSLRQSAAVLPGCFQQNRCFGVKKRVLWHQANMPSKKILRIFLHKNIAHRCRCRPISGSIGRRPGFEPKTLVPSIVVNATVPCLCPNRSHSPRSERYASINSLAIFRMIARAAPPRQPKACLRLRAGFQFLRRCLSIARRLDCRPAREADWD
jgi:hypothetical protein